MTQLLLLVAFVTLTVSAVNYRHKGVVMGLSIELKGELEEQLIDRAYLTSILNKEFGSNLVNVPIEFIDINYVEKLFNENPYVQNAEVYLDKHGLLKIEVKERTPIVRLKTINQTLYLDKEGALVPLSKQYSARLPIVIMDNDIDLELTEKKKQDILLLVNKINNTDFNKALIDQIIAHKNKTYTLIPLIGKERIRLGTTEYLDEKLKNLQIFYKKQIGKGRWSECAIIDVRFRGQVVCDKINT